MMAVMQSAAATTTTTSSLPLAQSQGNPIVVADKNPLGMSMGTSKFAGGIPKHSAPAASKVAAMPKSSWNRELDFSGSMKTPPTEKKGGSRNNKRRTPRGQAQGKDSGPYSPPTSIALSPASPAVVTAPATPSGSPIKAVSLRPTAPAFMPCAATATIVVTPSPTMGEPSSPPKSTDPSEPPTPTPTPTPTSNWKEDSKVKNEHIIYLQSRFREGLKVEEIAKQMGAEFPELCKGMRNGCKTATEETRLEAVRDAIFMHTRRYAVWHV